MYLHCCTASTGLESMLERLFLAVGSMHSEFPLRCLPKLQCLLLDVLQPNGIASQLTSVMRCILQQTLRHPQDLVYCHDACTPVALSAQGFHMRHRTGSSPQGELLPQRPAVHRHGACSRPRKQSPCRQCHVNSQDLQPPPHKSTTSTLKCTNRYNATDSSCEQQETGPRTWAEAYQNWACSLKASESVVVISAPCGGPDSMQ